jgi:hypothetical protein
LTRLEVAALLTERMTRLGSETVSRDTRTSVPSLLAMIDGTELFNRKTLRYLKLRRVSYFVPDGKMNHG